MSRAKNEGWGDEFEDCVAAGLIMCYETKIRKNKGSAPSDRLNEKVLSWVRDEGLFFPNPERIFLAPEDVRDKDSVFRIDTLYKRPTRAVLAVPCTGETNKDEYLGYLTATAVRKVEALGDGWSKQKAGDIYQMYVLAADSRGVHGDRRYVTIGTDGVVVACDRHCAVNSYAPGAPSKHVRMSDCDAHVLKETEFWTAIALDCEADAGNTWTITAEERNAKAKFGCTAEEVKSLLYARSVPLSVTGRKRPILHMVNCHKRRVAAGTDIDIASFMRGISQVEMHGTRYTITPSEVLKKALYARLPK